jgi:hypothetical protein
MHKLVVGVALVVLPALMVCCRKGRSENGRWKEQTSSRYGRHLVVEQSLNEAFADLVAAMEKGDLAAVAPLTAPPSRPYYQLEHLVRGDPDPVKRLRQVGALWKSKGVCFHRKEGDRVFGLLGPRAPSRTGACFVRLEERWKFCGWAPGV